VRASAASFMTAAGFLLQWGALESEPSLVARGNCWHCGAARPGPAGQFVSLGSRPSRSTVPQSLKQPYRDGKPVSCCRHRRVSETFENLKNALIINVILAVFNLLPLPPLDGGRIAVGLLPKALASPLAGLEPYGMIILIGVLFILPMIGAQLGIDLNVVSQSISAVTGAVIGIILWITGHT
jgi:hypothetical protein